MTDWVFGDYENDDQYRYGAHASDEKRNLQNVYYYYDPSYGLSFYYNDGYGDYYNIAYGENYNTYYKVYTAQWTTTTTTSTTTTTYIPDNSGSTYQSGYKSSGSGYQSSSTGYKASNTGTYTKPKTTTTSTAKKSNSTSNGTVATVEVKKIKDGDKCEMDHECESYCCEKNIIVMPQEGLFDMYGLRPQYYDTAKKVYEAPGQEKYYYTDSSGNYNVEYGCYSYAYYDAYKKYYE